MATQAHCAYCFECLSASFEKRPPLGLDQVETLWEKYTDDTGDASDAKGAADITQITDATISGRPAAISRLLAGSPSATSSSSPSTSSSTPSLSTDTSSNSSSRLSLSAEKAAGAKGAKSNEEFPLFVTWNAINRSGSIRLRGCIGTFEPHNLDDGLRSYALTSAFDDTRFNPISSRELPNLQCAVTLLTDFEPAADAMAWEIGKHGIRISFTHNGRRYGATYLPDVAKEQGWTKEEAMVSLMRKAGWNGRKDDWKKVGDLNVITYQGKKVDLDYREWKEWRDWVDKSV